jgi:hypothetical protein
MARLTWPAVEVSIVLLRQYSPTTEGDHWGDPTQTPRQEALAAAHTAMARERWTRMPEIGGQAFELAMRLTPPSNVAEAPKPFPRRLLTGVPPTPASAPAADRAIPTGFALRRTKSPPAAIQTPHEGPEGPRPEPPDGDDNTPLPAQGEATPSTMASSRASTQFSSLDDDGALAPPPHTTEEADNAARDATGDDDDDGRAHTARGDDGAPSHSDGGPGKGDEPHPAMILYELRTQAMTRARAAPHPQQSPRRRKRLTHEPTSTGRGFPSTKEATTTTPRRGEATPTTPGQ